MALDSSGLSSRIVSHAKALGRFTQVLDHEPVSAPGSGLTYAVWLTDLGPVPAGSGLAATTARVEFTGRVFLPADTEPKGAVETGVLGAVDAVCGAYSSDFTLGGTVRKVDLLGAYGPPLRARFGYLPLGSTTYRIATLTIPLIINDAWGQAA